MEYQTTAEATSDLIGNKTANKINENDKKISKTIDDLTLKNSAIMEYQNIINLLANTPEQQSKFKTKNRIGIDDWLYGVYNTGSPIRFKTSMLRSVFRDYGDTCILVKGRAAPSNRNKKKNKKLCFICWLHKS